MITVEDHNVACGFGSALLELAAAKLPAGRLSAIKMLGAPGRFVGHNSRAKQLMEAGVNADKIVLTAKQLLQAQA